MKPIISFLLVLTMSSVTQVTAQEKKPAVPSTGKDGVSHVDATGAKKLIEDSAGRKEATVTVLDVRTPDEYKAGHIKGAVNVDFLGGKFEEDLAKLDKSRTYVVHCQSGGRSTRSLEVFKKLGFKSVIHLDGGMNAWQKEKLPVTK